MIGSCAHAEEVKGFQHFENQTGTSSGLHMGDSINVDACADLCLQVNNYLFLTTNNNLKMVKESPRGLLNKSFSLFLQSRFTVKV